MMLWVNLIMDTMGALALGTEVPDEVLLKRRPYKRTASLVSNPMWRNILAQSLYQLVLLLVLLFAGADLFGVNPNGACLEESTTYPGVCGRGKSDYTHYSIIFNTFVFCQFFNEINARSIGDEWNVFAGRGTNPMFLLVLAFTFLFQVFVIEVGEDFTKTTGLSLTVSISILVIICLHVCNTADLFVLALGLVYSPRSCLLASRRGHALSSN